MAANTVMKDWETYYRWGLYLNDKGYLRLSPSEYADYMFSGASKGLSVEPSSFARRIARKINEN